MLDKNARSFDHVRQNYAKSLSCSELVKSSDYVEEKNHQIVVRMVWLRCVSYLSLWIFQY